MEYEDADRTLLYGPP